MTQEQIFGAALANNPFNMTDNPTQAGAFHDGFEQGVMWMQDLMQRRVEAEMEGGELIAYNCERRIRDEAVREFEQFIDYLRDTGKITQEEHDDNQWVSIFKSALV